MCMHKSENKIRWTELKWQLLTACKINCRVKASSPVWNAKIHNSTTEKTEFTQTLAYLSRSKI